MLSQIVIQYYMYITSLEHTKVRLTKEFTGLKMVDEQKQWKDSGVDQEKTRKGTSNKRITMLLLRTLISNIKSLIFQAPGSRYASSEVVRNATQWVRKWMPNGVQR